MVAAKVLGPVILLTGAQLGMYRHIPGLSRGTLLGLSDVTMSGGMLGVVILHWEMYTGPHDSHQHLNAPKSETNVHTSNHSHAAATPVDGKATATTLHSATQ